MWKAFVGGLHVGHVLVGVRVHRHEGTPSCGTPWLSERRSLPGGIRNLLPATCGPPSLTGSVRSGLDLLSGTSRAVIRVPGIDLGARPKN